MKQLMNKNSPSIPYLEIENEEFKVNASTKLVPEGRIGIIVKAAKQQKIVPYPSLTLAWRE